VQEHPHAIQLIEADLDEVVAAAERAELHVPVRRDGLGARRVHQDQLADPALGLRIVDAGVVLAG
jgi:hypothetical protein